MIKAVKAEGVAAADIKTQGMSVYQQEESYWDNGVQKSRPSSWRVSNNIEITIRDTDKVKSVMAALTDSGATNVNGPYYSVNNQADPMDESLRKAAYEDAVRKAQQMAKLAGRKLGKVLSMEEGGTSQNIYPVTGLGGGGGGGFEPGTAAVARMVTVEFELE